MDAGVDQDEQRPGLGTAGLLLTEAASVSHAIRSAAAAEVSEMLAAAARDVDRLLALATREADEVLAAATTRAEAMLAAAAEAADAEQAGSGRRSREAVLAAVTEGERLRAEAHDRGRRVSLDAERRVDDLLTSTGKRVADIEVAARRSADELPAAAARQASDRLTELREALEQASVARSVAEREATIVREEAARTAAATAEEARKDLEMARRVRAIARRDASAVMADAMATAARTLRQAAMQYDAANDLLVEEARGPRDEPPPESGPGAGAVGVQPTIEPPVVQPEVVEPPAASEVEAPVVPEVPLLVPVLSFGRELVLRLIVLAAAMTTAWFWLWWLATGHGEWTFGSVTATLLLAWVFGLSGYFFFFVCRMSRPNPALPIPDLRVAMVVTKAPAEAWSVLQQTIEAMLAQEFDLPYDIWIADERPTLETLLWCLEHGVKVSTRNGVEEYHRPTWPRRTKSKEGNLAYFYDQVGYERYDVVVQLDADHVPAPTYLAAMARPFADPRVGYVSAPSICDANVQEGWTVRGRLYREAAMHGPVQAGCNGGYAPVCIGSHYAVRTAALRDIGGIGPELAEDYSTTLWFQAAGWDGVFSIDAVAHGDGPATVEEMLVQEVQWARSLGTIMTRWAPGRLGSVPWRARPRLAFALVYYPVSGLVVALAAAAPVVGVLTRTSWGNTSLASFYIHLWPHTIVSMALVIFLRRCMVLRPVNGKVWSWELLLFQLLRWPWTTWGFFEGAYAGLSSKVINFRVTPKSVPGAQALPARYLVPTLVLGTVPAWIVVLVGDPGPTVGLMVLAALQALIYLGCASLVVALHLAGNRRRLRAATTPTSETGLSPWDAGQAAARLTAFVAAPTVVALFWRLSTL